jgi:sugar phosphate isomerase/epimerase
MRDQNIRIAVLGCYVTLLDTDLERRASAIRLFEEHLRVARDMGNPLVGTETTSFRPNFAPEFSFEALCFVLERLLNTAEKCGARIGIEPVTPFDTLHSIEKTVRLLELFPTPSLSIIWDVVNLLPYHGMTEQVNYFKDCLEGFGSRIGAVHAKDFVMREGHKAGDLPALTGELDYRTLLPLLNERLPGVDILLENSKANTIGDLRALEETL